MPDRSCVEAGAPGLHFYTLNLEGSVRQIIKQLSQGSGADIGDPLVDPKDAQRQAVAAAGWVPNEDIVPDLLSEDAESWPVVLSNVDGVVVLPAPIPPANPLSDAEVWPICAKEFVLAVAMPCVWASIFKITCCSCGDTLYFLK